MAEEVVATSDVTQRTEKDETARVMTVANGLANLLETVAENLKESAAQSWKEIVKQLESVDSVALLHKLVKEPAMEMVIVAVGSALHVRCLPNQRSLLQCSSSCQGVVCQRKAVGQSHQRSGRDQCPVVEVELGQEELLVLEEEENEGKL